MSDEAAQELKPEKSIEELTSEALPEGAVLETTAAETATIPDQDEPEAPPAKA
jgi:hypothetical protein